MTTSELDLRAALPVQRTAADTGVEIDPPPPGRALIACACGRVLDARDMHRHRPRHPGGHPIARITCRSCS